jgi:hypothetical protein
VLGIGSEASNVGAWHKVRAQPGAYEGTKTAALPTLGIKGRFTVYGAGLESMSALVNSIIERAGAANGGPPPLTSKCAWCSIGHKRPRADLAALNSTTELGGFAETIAGVVKIGIGKS